MKYSQNLVWKAVCDIEPGIKAAREKGIPYSLPEALRSAAVNYFTNIMYEFEIQNYNTLLAGDIVRTALKELQNEGFMTFGTTDEYGM